MKAVNTTVLVTHAVMDAATVLDFMLIFLGMDQASHSPAIVVRTDNVFSRGPIMGRLVGKRFSAINSTAAEPTPAFGPNSR